MSQIHLIYQETGSGEAVMQWLRDSAIEPLTLAHRPTRYDCVTLGRNIFYHYREPVVLLLPAVGPDEEKKSVLNDVSASLRVRAGSIPFLVLIGPFDAENQRRLTDFLNSDTVRNALADREFA